MKNVMTRAWEMYKNAGCATKAEFALALKAAWAEYKSQKTASKSPVVVASFDSYNRRRYSTPWVGIVEDGSMNFAKKVGGYTGGYNSGDEGDVYVTAPIEGQVYGYGQKDYRGGKTVVEYIIYTNGAFAPCDKIGNTDRHSA